VAYVLRELAAQFEPQGAFPSRGERLGGLVKWPDTVLGAVGRWSLTPGPRGARKLAQEVIK
jgi:hypothetical protein